MMRRGLPRARHVAVWLAACSTLLTACASSPPPSTQDPLQGATSRSTLPPNVGPADCQPPSPQSRIDLGIETQAASDGGEIWALFDTEPPLRSGTDLTVWWRMAGRQALELVLVGAGDREVPVADPQPDPSLGWSRPGDQWKSTISFPQPGCWRISATRDSEHGDIWVQVG